jgi:mannose-6-phosphate isomerase-like protein (cupin superfamily)
MGGMPSDELSALDFADAPTVMAPDGSTVRVLLAGAGGSMARFELQPGQTSTATRHRTVEELWYVLDGRGEMWRRSGLAESVVALEAGLCLLIKPGTTFQFRALGEAGLIVLGVTMPPWPGAYEAELVDGCQDWAPMP